MSNCEVIILGSGGWIPTEKRHTASYMFLNDNNCILLDTGSGICRLAAYTDRLEKYDIINIIYSHYHHDHLIGLIYLLNWVKNKKIRIWGPGKPYYLNSSKKYLSDYTSSPFFVHGIKDFSKDVSIYDYSEKGFKIGDDFISIIKQQHSEPCFGICISDLLYYATDTTVIDETFINAKKCKLLLHEFWSISDNSNPAHSSAELIIKKAEQFSILRTGLIHYNPNFSSKESIELEKYIGKESKIFLAEDNMIIDFD